MYHVNLTPPLETTCNIQNKLVFIQNKISDYRPNQLIETLSDKIHNTIILSQHLQIKLNNFSKRSRVKRGLVNIVGTASKWLFGTLDADDEQYIHTYLDQLKLNQQKIQQNLNKHHIILNSLIKLHDDNFKTLEENQNKLQQQLTALIREVNYRDDSQQIISLSHIVDSFILQLNMIGSFINTLETAMSFAYTHVLHSSIISPDKLQSTISLVNTIYKVRRVPELSNIMNYYSLLSAQVIIGENVILFKIHIPIIDSITYKYFQLYPIPISNKMIIPEDSYLLLNNYNNWTSEEECPQVEDKYYCLHTKLHKKQPCLATLIGSGKNQCEQQYVNLTQTNVLQISSNKLLVIPATTVNLKALCSVEGLYEVKHPSVIHLDNCSVEIMDKHFQTEDTLKQEFIFNLPSVNVSAEKPQKQRIMQLKHLDLTGIKHLSTMTDNLNLQDISFPHTHMWTNTVIVIILLITLISALLLIRFYVKPKSRIQKMQEPSFSDLGREESCI